MIRPKLGSGKLLFCYGVVVGVVLALCVHYVMFMQVQLRINTVKTLKSSLDQATLLLAGNKLVQTPVKLNGKLLVLDTSGVIRAQVDTMQEWQIQQAALDTQSNKSSIMPDAFSKGVEKKIEEVRPDEQVNSNNKSS